MPTNYMYHLNTGGNLRTNKNFILEPFGVGHLKLGQWVRLKACKQTFQLRLTNFVSSESEMAQMYLV